MEYFICILLLAVGIVLIVKGGDWFVDSAIWVAEISRIPQFIIGATIVSLATTLPELLVSSIAAGKGQAEMAVGNAIGSVTANTGLILAISIVFAPAIIKRKDFILRSIVLMLSVAILYLLSYKGILNPYLSILMFIPLIVFMWDNIKSAKKEMIKPEDDGVEISQEKQEPKKDKKTILINILKFVVGVACIVIGSDLLVDYGSKLASLFGISEGVIAVTIVAIGTSLPELVTTITALIKKSSDLSVGNIVGANIIDICLILPICAIISAAVGASGLPVARQSILLDFPFCLGISVVALVPALISEKFKRWQGITMLLMYVAYLTLCVLLTEGVI